MTGLSSVTLQESQITRTTVGLVATAKQVAQTVVTPSTLYSFVSKALPYMINSKTAIPLVTVLYVASPDKVKDLARDILSIPMKVLNQFNEPDSVDSGAKNVQNVQIVNESTAQMLDTCFHTQALLTEQGNLNKAIQEAEGRIAVLGTEEGKLEQRLGLLLQTWTDREQQLAQACAEQEQALQLQETSSAKLVATTPLPTDAIYTE